MSQGARVTVIVSAELMDAANHVHVLLGKARRPHRAKSSQWSQITHKRFFRRRVCNGCQRATDIYST